LALAFSKDNISNTMSRSSKKSKLIKPKALKPGDCFGIVTPSFPGNVVLKSKFDKGICFLEAQGFRVKLGELTKAELSQGYRTGTAEQRATEFNALYQDDEVDALVFTIGGNNSSSLLPHLDYQYISNHPKIVSGFSDVTSIHAALLSQCNLTTFYGPALIPSFGTHPKPDSFTWENFLIQTGYHGRFKTYTFPCPPKYTNQFIDARDENWTKKKRMFKKNPGWKIIRAGKTRAPIYSFNLNTLVSLAGTPYFPDLRNSILCLEQMNTSMAQEERQFMQLKLMGVLDEISGLIISKPENFDDNNSSISYPELILELLPHKTKYPVIFNFDCGHTHPMLTIAQGVICELNADSDVRLVQQECGFAT
jgi:muramoyltetrapeptide carboxypeptidase